MSIQVRSVTVETRQAFASLLDKANAWQKARGSLYFAYLSDEAVAAFRLLDEDRAFWGEREVGDSIYLHTFAVQRSRAGSGIGSMVIEEVVRVGRERGRSRIRLDCFLANTGLITFYERNGFRSVGTVAVKDRVLNLMERPIDLA